jgi:uncharacterized metal-binding protein
MSTKIFKRIGVVFFCGPVVIIGFLSHIFLILTVIIWGPIYYIITGNDPIDVDGTYPLDLSEKIIDWYFIHFDPE